jgi:predicted ArsR family transcriptional regulator
MDARQLLVPEASGPLGDSRAAVLEMLRAAAGPLGVREVAQPAGLHPNTARFHLEGLVHAGLAVREVLDRGTPGRPRIGYRAAADAGAAGSRRYRLLAGMLAGLIGDAVQHPQRQVENAGREWGEYLTEQPPPYRRPDVAQAVGQLVDIMAELGFAPNATAEDAGRRYRLGLRHCPFREVAEQHPEVICTLHLGMIRGALARMRAPLTAASLEPFAEPGLCVAHLKADAGAPVTG